MDTQFPTKKRNWSTDEQIIILRNISRRLLICFSEIRKEHFVESLGKHVQRFKFNITITHACWTPMLTSLAPLFTLFWRETCRVKNVIIRICMKAGFPLQNSNTLSIRNNALTKDGNVSLGVTCPVSINTFIDRRNKTFTIPGNCLKV